MKTAILITLALALGLSIGYVISQYARGGRIHELLLPNQQMMKGHPRCCGLQISDTRLANSSGGGLTFRANGRGCRLTIAVTGLALRAHSLHTSARAHRV